MKTHFYMKGFALSLALKQRIKATRKWPIEKQTLDGSVPRVVSLLQSSCLYHGESQLSLELKTSKATRLKKKVI